MAAAGVVTAAHMNIIPLVVAEFVSLGGRDHSTNKLAISNKRCHPYNNPFSECELCDSGSHNLGHTRARGSRVSWKRVVEW